LPRSLALAGESQEEFQAHLSLFDRAFLPQDAAEAKLVRGLGEAAWLRLRAFRTQARWEGAALAACLEQAAAAPQLSREVTQGLAFAVVVRVFHLDQPRLLAAVRRLDRRLERLSRALLRQRSGGAEPDFQCCARPLPSEHLMPEWPAAALSNPFLSAASVARVLEERPAAAAEGGSRRAGGARPEVLLSQAKSLRYGLMRRLLVEAMPARDGLPAEEDFAAHLARVERALLREKAEGPVPAAKWRALVKTVAEATWARLEVFRKQAEAEAENLKRLLEQAAGEHTGTGAAMSVGKTRALAARLVGIFSQELEAFELAADRDGQVQRAFYKLLRKRYGDHPDFKFYKPEPRRDEPSGSLLSPFFEALARAQADSAENGDDPQARAP
jgi:hypothetical protein